MEKQEALFKYLLRLADDGLILGHRLAEWCSKAPFLEEDLALTNFSLDLIGRSQALLVHAGKIEGKNHSDDDLAYKRGEREFYNHLICELPNGDFGFTIARQFIVSTYELLVYEGLLKSKDETIAAVAAKSIKEIRYHQKHAADWMLRLGDGTAESHQRIQNSLNDIWMYTGELFEMDEVDQLMVKEGIGVDTKALKPEWEKRIGAVLTEATLTKPADGFMQSGSKKGVHTEYLGYILTDMQYLQRAYPDAKW